LQVASNILEEPASSILPEVPQAIWKLYLYFIFTFHFCIIYERNEKSI